MDQCMTCSKSFSVYAERYDDINGCWKNAEVNYCPTCGKPLRNFSKKTKKDSETSDAVNHPSHYAEGRKYEPIDVIDDWELGFCLGNVVKYISRAGRKDDYIQDLNKAKFYLEHEIKSVEEARNGR